MFSSRTFLLLLLVAILLATPVAAFGAGEVPSGSDFKGYVWRHGDITEVLKYLPASFITHYRFTQIQRKQIYFGNWLRDFSQVIDTTCLEAVPEPILRAIVSVLAFMEFGFATDEFDVTRERLGCYTHVEHIDNPQGYQDNAQDIDKRLRGPVLPEELEFDSRTGMKNYIANSGHGWRTSADYVREQLKQCVALGRVGRKRRNAGQRKESMIHLGAALHTLEDFSAHSNFVELCLHELGEDNVFTLVGDACRVKTPGVSGKKVPPIVTGTFGMLDIFHSLLGEADDMAILQSKGTLGSLEDKLDFGGPAFEQLFELIKKGIETVNKVTPDKVPLMEELNAVAMIFKKATDTISPPDSDSEDKADDAANPNLLWQTIEPVFYLHDRISKWLQEGTEETEESMADISTSQLSDYTNQLVFRFLAVMIESSVKELRKAVKAAKDRVDAEAAKAASAAVYEDGADASDPSHSDLSKDHFGNVLNQPAGLVGTVTTNWTTQQIVRCWDDPSIDEDQAIDEILTVLHHPAFPKKKTPIQQYMFDTVKGWWEACRPEEKERLRAKLTKESVKNRGHEDHDLTLKDLVAAGRPRGPASFPGSQPEVKQPPKKVSFPLAWAINELGRDINFIFTTTKKSFSDPVGAVGDVITGTGSFISRTTLAAISVPRWFARQAGHLGSKIWPFGSGRNTT
ncbi:heterokaryon incompatibility Het-C [Truncatella angustata]|uniref:Heterokaryon incompatibility Het-C n=1 Tax=Truncatella angustata TaxID=152316 RepID=A0A9P8RJ33_9PEZI|nr:heterokaryon incompatibility Het-C [Truncatella angustata]KAH6646959.1 heterokaryon incompatibility Het-C [Truncatella angustata]